LSATAASRPFSSVISFLTSAHGSWEQSINSLPNRRGEAYFVELIDGRGDGSYFILWYATYFEKSIEDFPVVKLSRM
jgi:hypothetical protein